MDSDGDLLELSRRIGPRLLDARVRLTTAESCTGGWLAKILTDVPGSSGWFECGYVTYSNAAKMRDLGVAPQTLADYGAVSDATVREMAQGALRRAAAGLAVSISGVAGPDGGTAEKPVGTVWFGLAIAPGGVSVEEARAEPTVHVSCEYFAGDRASVRRAAVAYALRLLHRVELPEVSA